MTRKIIPVIFIVMVSVLAIILLAGGWTNNDDDDDDDNALRQTFQIDALYRDSGHVEISYLDRHGKTNSVVMEILGMRTSFQKTFSDSEFVEIVPFPNLPKYGWPAHPVILEIEHEEFGHVQLKTEIHFLDESVPPVIYSRP